MGKKIKVVDIVPEETSIPEQETIVNEEHHETPAKTTDDVPPTSSVDVITEESVVDVLVEAPQKPRAKQTGRSKKKEVVATPEVQAEPTQEVKQEVEVVKEEPVKKVVEQVKCPKCDKMMSQKSLRYTHEQNCRGKTVKTEDLPVKRRSKNEVTKSNHQTPTNKKEVYNEIVGKNVDINTSEVHIPEELKAEVFKSIQRQHARLKMREDNLNRLRMQIA